MGGTCRKHEADEKYIRILDLQPWRWRQYVPPKRWHLPTSLHGAKTQKNNIIHHRRFLVGETKGKITGVEVKIILKWILKKSGVKVCTGYELLGFCEHANEHLDYNKANSLLISCSTVNFSGNIFGLFGCSVISLRRKFFLGVRLSTRRWSPIECGM
jgi:hypothetical protein